ncbi:LuxR C-terminal-related transcriptional regulator [Streptomyces sp. BH055]|uniref:LuxR C-terminal-related transcriptional regulator n=1 Tax=Streptomyces sp. BH055 TaxID=3401173 RepID=UPI003BB6FBD9
MLSKNISARERETYRQVAAGGQPSPSQDTDRLTALGLIEQRSYDGTWTAYDPRAVARGVMERAVGELAHALAQMQHIPALETLATDFDPHRVYGGPSSEFIASKAEMNRRIGDVAAAATTSVLTAQPGAPADRDPEVVEVGVQRTIDALHAGIDVRSLYSPLATGHAQTSNNVDRLLEEGADVRTLAGAFPRMMIIDDRHLFTNNHFFPAAPADSGWHTTDRSVVTWARAVFDFVWGQASTWDLDRGQVLPVTTWRQRQILAELEAGYNKQQAARRLDCAERTVTKELTTLRESLGMSTLYQVMVWWATCPDRHLQ